MKELNIKISGHKDTNSILNAKQQEWAITKSKQSVIILAGKEFKPYLEKDLNRLLLELKKAIRHDKNLYNVDKKEFYLIGIQQSRLLFNLLVKKYYNRDKIMNNETANSIECTIKLRFKNNSSFNIEENKLSYFIVDCVNKASKMSAIEKHIFCKRTCLTANYIWHNLLKTIQKWQWYDFRACPTLEEVEVVLNKLFEEKYNYSKKQYIKDIQNAFGRRK